MTIISITLQYADGSTWYAGEFCGPDEATAQAAANAWVAGEQAKPYWASTTQVLQTITTVTPDGP